MDNSRTVGIVLNLCLLALSQASVVGAAQGAAGTWPPPGVYRASEPGVALPRLVSQVRPRYTSAALQAKIEGAVTLECIVETDGSVGEVRVARSLDATTGLDNQAVGAAKQWRFVAGTKDNVPARVLVSIQLTFSLTTPTPGPIGLPDGFLPAPRQGAAAPVPDAEWNEDVVDDSGLRMHIAYPKAWMARVESGTRRAELIRTVHGDSQWLVDVGRPQVTRMPLSGPLPAATLQRFAEGLTQTYSASNRAELRGMGQLQIGGRPWLWVDTWIGSPTAFSSLPPEIDAALRSLLDGFHVWSFVTTEGDQMIQVSCSVLLRRNTSADDTAAETRLAGGMFVEMLKRMTFAHVQ